MERRQGEVPEPKGATARSRRTTIIVAAGVLVVALVVLGAAWFGREGTSGLATEVVSGRAVAAAESVGLPSTGGGNVTLSQLRGSPGVVYFYEGSTCGPCQQQLVKLQQHLGEISALHARIVGVSVDPIATSRSLAAQLHLGFPLVEETGHRIGAAFGVFRLPSGMDMGPVDGHSIFVLSPNGHVVWKELAPESMHVPVSDVIGALKRLEG